MCCTDRIHLTGDVISVLSKLNVIHDIGVKKIKAYQLMN